MLHPAYEILLINGIEAKFVKQAPILMCDSIVSFLNDCSLEGIVSYSEWATVRVFFDSYHVCNINIDEHGVTFEYDSKGPMLSDMRSNRVIYSVIQAVAAQKYSTDK
tara:strand:+ start:10173 stop:10493 length:321 start_codon:yes stop_codon:yes gene_type:complete